MKSSTFSTVGGDCATLALPGWWEDSEKGMDVLAMPGSPRAAAVGRIGSPEEPDVAEEGVPEEADVPREADVSGGAAVPEDADVAGVDVPGPDVPDVPEEADELPPCMSVELTADLAGRLGKSDVSLLSPKSKRPKIKISAHIYIIEH